MHVDAERSIAIDGLTFRVRTAGVGPPLLFLHGFPDSGDLWRLQVPAVVAAGFQAIVPDLRGMGATDAPADVSGYRMARLVDDVIEIVDAVAADAGPVGLVGHDWGAAVGWCACAARPERFRRFAALSVGHPEAYRRAGLRQKLKGWYLFLFITPGLAEATLRARDFRGLRRAAPTPEDGERWAQDLARPGRLTAALSWYRANATGVFGPSVSSIRVPTLGIYSTRDPALAEDQMANSGGYVDASWRYARIPDVGHWLQIEAADEVNPLLVDWFRADTTDHEADR